MADRDDRWTRAQVLFEQALGQPPDAQDTWLRAACGTDDDLYREAAALLDGDRNRLDLLDGNAGALLSPAAFGSALGLESTLGHEGERVGPWRLGERIGEGGMGTVYRADRVDGGYEQTAALKLIKPGMDSEAVVARFQTERQILARLQHPGIARLLGGGLTDDRRPYFAMELIEGDPITRYCDERRLGIKARLRLFVRVCEAVRYAHQSLVIHRDLKPSNILIVERAEEPPRPVLLDFGIARLLGDEEVSDGKVAPELTKTGQRVLTPAYAAPEQLRGEVPTTATDVYALGGLLYRLMCGAPPVEIQGRSTAEVELAVLNETPRRPSEQVAEDAARERGTTTEALGKRLRRDLDVICMTALRKEPEERYGSAGELLSDVQRHLDGLPIEARPATRRYRAGLFLQRHRAAVLGAAAALVALVALASFYTVRLANERDRAQQARDRAQLEADKANEVIAFLEGLFISSDPAESRGADITARDLLADGAERIESELASQPEVQAQLYGTIGRVYKSLGLLEEADTTLQRSLDLHLSAEADPLVIARAQADLGVVYSTQNEFEAADSLLRLALATQRDLYAEPHPDLVRTLETYGNFLLERGDYPGAESPFLEALDFQRALDSTDHPATASLLTGLGATYRYMGNFQASAQRYEEGLAMRRRLFGDLHPATTESIRQAAITQRLLENFDASEQLIREAIALDSQLVGLEHPSIGEDLYEYGNLLNDTGRFDEATAMFERSLAVDKATLGEDHPYIAITLGELGSVRDRAGDRPGSIRYFRQGVNLARRVLPPDHPQLAGLVRMLGEALVYAEDYEEGERLLREALAISRSRFGDDHVQVLTIRSGIGTLLTRLGRLDEAIELYRDVLERRQRTLGESSTTARSLYNLAAALRAKGTPEALAEARPVIAQAVEQYRAIFPDENLKVGHALLEQAEVLNALGEQAEAAAGYREALHIFRPTLDEDHPTIRRIERALADVES